MNTNYAEKLKDPRWQRIRLEVLDRDGWRCRLCDNADEELNVHHITYSGTDPWDIPVERLVTTCRHCHGYLKHCTTAEQIAAFHRMIALVKAGRLMADPEIRGVVMNAIAGEEA